MRFIKLGTTWLRRAAGSGRGTLAALHTNGTAKSAGATAGATGRRPLAVAVLPVVLVSLLAASHATLANKFVAAWIFPTSGTVTTPWMAEGDFNGDGKPDLVFPFEENPGTVGVLLGKGDGTFQLPISGASAGTYPVSVAVGDFNGDGKLDVVVANHASKSNENGDVTVLLGEGNGKFQNGNSFAVGTSPGPILVGDFNNDGKLDVAVLNSSDSNGNGTVSVLLGNGDGTLQSPVTLSVSGNPAWIASGDFNGDGNLDLITTNSRTSNITLFLGNGNGTFQPGSNTYIGGTPGFVVVGDFSHDGKLDLAMLAGGADVWILLGNGNGTFQSPAKYATGSAPGIVTLADLNHDGNLDLVVPNGAGTTGGSFDVLLGNADGTFQPYTAYTTVSGLSQTLVADFNGDGNPDVVGLDYYSGSYSNTISEVFGKGDGTFIIAPIYGLEGLAYAGLSADFNNDGIPDLAFAVSGITVLLGNGDGTFQAPVLGTANGATSLAVGDFNGDGKLDVAAPTGSNVAVLLGNGNGTFGSPAYYVADSYPAWVAVGDVNGDGKLDLVAVNSGSNDISVLLGNGDGTFKSPANYNTGGLGGISVILGDFNGDGKLDVAIANYAGGPEGGTSGSISVMLGNGDGTFGAPTQYNKTNYDWNFVTTADLNGDGKLDLVITGYYLFGGTELGVMLGKGDGTFEPTKYYAAGLAPYSAVIKDFNGDGRLDVAVGNWDGLVEVLYGSSTGLQAAVPYGGGTNPAYLAAADFNGDGAIDLAAATALGTTTSVLLNTGGTVITTTSSENPSGVGQAVTFTATVAASIAGPANPASPTGSVTFLDGSSKLGTVDLSSGSASLTTSTLSLGLHTITASYSGDANFNPHIGPPLTQNVISGPLVVLSPTSLNFGSQIVGTTSPPQTVTLTNNGVATLTITSIAASGDFAETNSCGSSLTAGSSCVINVTFSPTVIGTRTGSVSVTDNAPGSPQSVSLTGIGSAPVVQLSPSSLTFATQLIKTSSPTQTVTLTNTGTATLILTSISFTGKDPNDFYQQNACSSSLAAGASCTISVLFRPNFPGTRTAALSVADNAAGSPQTASLTGTGTVVSLSATSINFGSVAVGKTSAPNSFTLTNVGSIALPVSKISITGADPQDFAQTNTCGSSVAAGASCSISVTFTPTVKGGRSAAVSIYDGGGSSPQTVSLSGTGT